MKRIYLWMMMGIAMLFASCAPEKVKVSVVATSDMESALFAYDYKFLTEARGGGAAISSYLNDLKKECGEQNVIYVDNGDALAGWPLNYYMKSIDKSETTIVAEAMNRLGCEVYSIGEGDLSTGSELLQRHVKSMKGAAVCANLLDAKSGKPLYKPYAVVERNGVKIAFLGLITEGVDKYISASMMESMGIKIADAESAAREWIEVIKKNENPDIVIGLFHTGASSVTKRNNLRENIGQTIVRNVAGFDAVVCGHDGLRREREVESIDGKKVTLASPGRRGMYVVEINIIGERGKNGLENKSVAVDIKSMLTRGADKEYSAALRPRTTEMGKALATPVAAVKGEAKAVDALFGSSAYVDLVHKMQLKYSGADLSVAHPYTIETGFAGGNISINDIRRFFPVGGKLYTVKMKGSEIKEMLLYSLTHYYKHVYKKEGSLLKYDREGKRLSENTKDLESIAGLRYNVHLNKKKDEGKLQILGLSNGIPFDLDKEYTVAVPEDMVMTVNLALSLGAKVKSHDMQQRIASISDKEIPELLLDYLKENKVVEMKALGNWSLQPAAWMKTIKENEMNKLANIYFPQSLIEEDMVEDVNK